MPWTKHSLGVSLEEGRLQLACLADSWRGPKLVASSSFPVPPAGEDPGALAPEVQKFLLRGGFRSLDAVTFAVPRSALLFRHVTTPPIKERNLPDLLGFEYHRHLPGGPEDFFVGYANQGRGEDGGYRLLIGAARRDMLEEHLHVLRSVHLSPTSLQPVPMALAEAFRFVYPQSSEALLLSRGSDSFTADYLTGGRVLLSRHFPLRGDPEESASAAARRLAESIVEHLRDPAFVDTLPEGAVASVWLHGFGESENTVMERLSYGLNVPVRIFSPLQHLGLQSPDGAFGASFGAALLGARGGSRGLEMSEERIESLREMPRYRTTAVLAAVCLALLAGNFGLQALHNRQYLKKIDGEVQALREKKAAVERLRASVQEKRRRLDYLNGTVGRRVRQADLLQELTRLIPEETYLSDYRFKKDQVQIGGLSPSSSRLLPILEASPVFEGAKFSSSIVSQGKDLERFKMNLGLEVAGGAED